ncbi:uncharacterized protein LOC141903574 [Tubulanus polymorphus]|uniref:uncharacterized protein LOC141903574 n=1 Tax=Tubulanus polymorphus TaxID=672921 RepID=UPI003DA62170
MLYGSVAILSSPGDRLGRKFESLVNMKISANNRRKKLEKKREDQRKRVEAIENISGDGIIPDSPALSSKLTAAVVIPKIVPGMLRDTKSKTHVERVTVEQKTKKTRWRVAPEGLVNFEYSLLPRVTNVEVDVEMLDDDTEFDDKYDVFSSRACSNDTRNQQIRKCKKNKIRKAHAGIRDFNCRKIKNDTRKSLYISSRMLTLRTERGALPERRRYRPKSSFPAGYPKRNIKQVIVDNRAGNMETIRSRHAAIVYTAHTLNHANAQTIRRHVTDRTAIDRLINLQHRELNPNDYELLLVLDQQIQAKTIDDEYLERLRVCKVNLDNTNPGEACSICLEIYALDQALKYLPCGHYFHDNCIDVWLTNSSVNCPLDGLPVTDS